MHKNTKRLCLSNCGKLLSGFILNTVCKSCHWSQSLKPRLVCYYFELDTHRLGFLFVTSLKYDRQSLIEVYKISKLHRSPGLYCIMTAVLLFFFFFINVFHSFNFLKVIHTVIWVEYLLSTYGANSTACDLWICDLMSVPG